MSKNKQCVFLGYSLNHSGYMCLDPVTNMVYISRHVTFDEQLFPFKNGFFSDSHSPTVHSSISTSPVNTPVTSPVNTPVTVTIPVISPSIVPITNKYFSYFIITSPLSNHS
ncbi:hypothetical protein EV2_031393 [Malus domestica]